MGTLVTPPGLVFPKAELRAEGKLGCSGGALEGAPRLTPALGAPGGTQLSHGQGLLRAVGAPQGLDPARVKPQLCRGPRPAQCPAPAPLPAVLSGKTAAGREE